MHQYLYLRGFHAEEPLGLDDLKSLIHHGGAVDGNLGAHVPRRMAQGIGLGDGGQLLVAHQTEGSAAGGEQNLLYLVVVLTDETLENGRVLAVDGQDGIVILLCQAADELAGDHQRLLVGQADGLTCLDGMDGGRESGKPHHGREHHVDRLCLYNLVEGIGTCIHLDVGQVGQQFLQTVVVRLVGDDHGGRLPLPGLLGQQFHFVVGCQAVHLVQVAMLFNHLQGLRADRACTAQNGYLFFHFFLLYIKVPKSRRAVQW